MRLALSVLLLLPAGSVAQDAADLEAGAPDIAVKRYQIGRELYRDGKLEQAEAEFRSAFDLFGTSPKLAFNLGRVNERLGRLADAVRFYQKYLELKPKAADRETVQQVVATLLSRLERDRPELVVTTAPAGAQIFLGAAKESAGVSPLTLRVESGSHAIRAELEGHASAAGTVNVVKGKPAAIALTLRATDQVAQAATLVVTSNPGGADVFIDAGSEPAGKTPLSVQVQPGSHAVRVVLEGFDAQTRTVDVEAGRNSALAIELAKPAPPVAVGAAPVAPRDPGNPVLSTLGYVLMAGGLAGIGVGSWYAAQASETAATSLDAGDRQGYDDTATELDGHNTKMWVGFGAGITSIVLGVTLSSLGAGDDVEEPSAWSVTPGGVHVRW